MKAIGHALEHVAALGAQRLLAPHRLAPGVRQRQRAGDARQQLARAERLDQVVVGAGLEALDARLLAGARRQQDDRHRARVVVGAAGARSRPKPSSRGIITSVSDEVGSLRAARRPAPARRRRPRSRVAPCRAGGAGSRACRRCRRRAARARATVGRARASASSRRRRHARSAPASPMPASGSQRSASSTNGCDADRRRHEPGARLDAVRGRCAWPNGSAHGERACRARAARRRRPRRRAAAPAPAPARARCPCPRACGRARPGRDGSDRRAAAAPPPECRCRCRAPRARASPRLARAGARAISPSSVYLNALETRLRTIFSHIVAVDDRPARRAAGSRRRGAGRRARSPSGTRSPDRR